MPVRVLPWIVRVGWALLPLVAGPAFAAALDDRSRGVQLVASVALWTAWAIGEVAAIVLHPASLTVVRVGAPAALAASVAAAISGASGAVVPAAIVLAVALTLVAMLPETALPYVNGPAYANERRFPLRPPGLLLLGPLPLAWAVSIATPAAGVLLLASKRWVLGAFVTALGLASAVVLGRSMYTLARRWLVFVPAGVVLHDPMTLADPVLFRRKDVRALRPAPADTDALDATAGAFGLALELELNQPASIAMVRTRSRAADTVEASKLLCAPTRPGAVLTEARARRLAPR